MVRVPVLSVQMLFAPPIISQEARVLTKFYSSFILPTAKANVIVTESGNPLDKYKRYFRNCNYNDSDSNHE